MFLKNNKIDRHAVPEKPLTNTKAETFDHKKADRSDNKKAESFDINTAKTFNNKKAETFDSKKNIRQQKGIRR